MTLAVEEVFNNRYRIDEILSHNDIKTVYRAWDMSLGMAVMIKENCDTSPEARRRSKSEATLLMRLAHPNLPRFTDYVFIPRQAHYLVMYFVDGESLQQRLDRDSSFTEAELLTLFIQTCNAVAYLHHQTPPIIHGDISPRNIVIQKDGRAILVGAGMAKVYQHDLRNQWAMNFLKPGYSALELYHGQLPDVLTDIYALGATVYYTLTKQPLDHVIDRSRDGEILTFPAQSEPIRVELKQAVAKALKVNPPQRYQTVNQFRAALELAIEGASSYRDALYVFPSRISTYIAGLTTLFFFACGILALTSLLADTDFGVGDITLLERATATVTATPTPAPQPIGTPTPPVMQRFKNVALGFALDYPDRWRKQESALDVRFSPTLDGLNVPQLRDMSIWVGISAENQTTPADILTEILKPFPQQQATLISQEPLAIAGQDWRSVQIQFNHDETGGMAVLAATIREDVGYFIVVASRANQWDVARPLFQQIVANFQFTKEAEVRFLSEDELPPTPTPTATPIIYIVQSGDSFGRISSLYNIDMAVLAEENDLRLSDVLRVGQELIIPLGYDE